MQGNINDTVLMLLNKSGDEILNLKIEAKLSEILSYLNRDEVTDDMFAPVCSVIAESLSENGISEGCVQSYSEGDMSISYSNSSPYFGRLDAFKVIRGIRKDVQK